jgi:hypothetical protein
MSLRDIAKRLVITTGAKKGQHPSPATVMRMLREHDERTAAAWRHRRSQRSGSAGPPRSTTGGFPAYLGATPLTVG